MLALGIDPGTAICGYGLVEMKNNVLRPVLYGSVFTDKDWKPEVRLQKIYGDISAILERYHPDLLSIEKLFSRGTSIRLSLWPSPVGLSCWRQASKGFPSWSSRPCRSSRL